MEIKISKQPKFFRACKKGNLVIVKKLLKDSQIDPAYDNNFAIEISGSNGHLEVVKELLKDSRVDPAINNNK